ncbi:hypothetical protein [Novosphingobium sp.]|uniref:hypothetical protein n=1 Tax=Novosphingobium sp. TaxID=1874826 RepID=UPI002734B893|nr:hypothetical protein [Novosphingobium sp.]MDP3905799.1 hypothetical protein [Novosphingobium sp.]
MSRNSVTGLVASLALVASAAGAQTAKPAVDPMTVVPDPASVPMPKLDFVSTPLIEADFDKYYFFNRAGTSFEEALADLRDCDGLARGLSSGYQYQAAPYPYTYTMAGAAGGVIANVMIAAIFGSVEKRRLRRVNMRRCMGYRGYDRFGLEKDLWQEFNFEEGFSGEGEDKRQAMLAQQAKVASGPRPAGKELGL